MIDLVAVIVALTLGSAGGPYNLECSTNLPEGASGAAYVAEEVPRVVLRPSPCQAFRRVLQHRIRTNALNVENTVLDGLGVALHEARHVYQYRAGWTDERSPAYLGPEWNVELDAECYVARNIDDMLVDLGYGARFASRVARQHLRLVQSGPPPYGGRCPPDFSDMVRRFLRSPRPVVGGFVIT